jgi:CTP:molybdopterin cytidylyltransferase MocA
MIVAIVPAAGLSRRMGRPKPLLDIGGVTLIARVVSALREGGADRVIVIAPPAERGESAEIVREAQAQGAEVVVLDGETADMRASIEAGLDRIGAWDDVEAILLAPADVPGIEGTLVARVIAAGPAPARSEAIPSTCPASWPGRSPRCRSESASTPWSMRRGARSSMWPSTTAARSAMSTRPRIISDGHRPANPRGRMSGNGPELPPQSHSPMS